MLRPCIFLLLLAGLLGCRGTITLGGDAFRLDDDDIVGDDDDTVGDDDDTVGDDDDTVGDDDDTSEFGDAVGVFTVLGVIQHPEGRYSQGVGYFFVNPDQPQPASAPPEQSVPRGGDYGCAATTPDSQGRGGDFVTLDAGPFADLWLPGDNWSYALDQVEQNGDQYYWATSQSGQPSAFPPDQLLSIYVPGGDDVPELGLDGLIPTQAPFAVGRPALTEGAQSLAINPDAGLPFQWTPGAQEGLGIGLDFADQATGEVWSIECWVEDSGSFLVEPALLRQMPDGVTGATWIRRLRGQWLDATSESPPMYGQGALQHRWLVQLFVTDG